MKLPKASKTETGYKIDYKGFTYLIEKRNGMWGIVDTTSELDTSPNFGKLKSLKAYIAENEEDDKSVDTIPAGQWIWDCPEPQYLLALAVGDNPTPLQLLTLDNYGLLTTIGEVDVESAQRHVDNWEKQYKGDLNDELVSSGQE